MQKAHLLSSRPSDADSSLRRVALLQDERRSRLQRQLQMLQMFGKAQQVLTTALTLLRMSISTSDAREETLRFHAHEDTGTEHNQRHQSAEHLHRKYKALLEGIPDAVFIAESRSGRIIEANQAAASLLETSVDEVVGRHQSDLHPSDEAEEYRAFFERHQEAAENGPATFRTFEDGSQLYVVSDTGTRVPVEISASFVDVPGEEVFVGLFRDITDQKRRERKLQEAKTEAEKASRLKSAMLRNVSHEIRTPITSIIGYSKVLTGMIGGKAQDHAEKIYQCGQQLMKRIQSILELSKLEADNQNIERRTVRLDHIAEWAVDLLEPQANKKQLTLEIRSPEEPVEAWGNREALNRIAENLLENAIKFTPEGGHIEIRVRKEEDAILEIEDTGIGMNADSIPDLFQAFKQGSEGLDREYEGIGLGLSIVQQLTKRLDGALDVESREGEGSRFTVRLPPGATERGEM